MPNEIRKSPQKEANRLLDLYQHVLGKNHFPIDVEALAREVSQKNPDPIGKIVGENLPGCEGMLRPHNKRPEWHIVYNEDPRYQGRVRFTIAHEFGHYMLHRRPLTADHYRDGELPDGFDFKCLPLRANHWKDAEKQREEDANTFASFLLMPLDDYRARVDGQEITADLLNQITNRYGVSLTAACLKWVNFTEKRAAMVVARDGFALWGRASTAAYESGVFIHSGMPIPEGSIAAMAPGARQTESGRPVALPAGIWTFSRGSESVRELTMVSELLDISLTILQFEDCDPAEIEDEEPWDTYDRFAGNHSDERNRTR